MRAVLDINVLYGAARRRLLIRNLPVPSTEQRWPGLAQHLLDRAAAGDYTFVSTPTTLYKFEDVMSRMVGGMMMSNKKPLKVPNAQTISRKAFRENMKAMVAEEGNLSADMLARVMARGRIADSVAHILFRDFQNYPEMVPVNSVPMVCDDREDDHVIATAVAAKIGSDFPYIVSSDQHVLDMSYDRRVERLAELRLRLEKRRMEFAEFETQEQDHLVARQAELGQLQSRIASEAARIQRHNKRKVRERGPTKGMTKLAAQIENRQAEIDNASKLIAKQIANKRRLVNKKEREVLAYQETMQRYLGSEIETSFRPYHFVKPGEFLTALKQHGLLEAQSRSQAELRTQTGQTHDTDGIGEVA